MFKEVLHFDFSHFFFLDYFILSLPWRERKRISDLYSKNKISKIIYLYIYRPTDLPIYPSNDRSIDRPTIYYLAMANTPMFKEALI